MLKARLGHNSHSIILIGLLTLAGACGNSAGDDDDGSGGTTASGGAGGSSSTSGGTSGASGGSAGTTGGTQATGGSAGTAGGTQATAGGGGSSGSPSTPEAFPTGFGPVETVLDGLTNPARVSFRDGYLYFTEPGRSGQPGSRLARIAPSGTVETLFSGEDVVALYLDETELFFVERGTLSVFRMPYTTLTPELFTQTELPVADIERIGERMWMTLFQTDTMRATGIYALDRTTKQRTELLSLTTNSPLIFTYLSAGGGNLYVSQIPFAAESPNFGLYKYTGTAPVLTVPGVFPQITSADDNHIYFGDENTGQVLRQAHGVDNQPEVLATGQEAPHTVQVRPGGIYWTTAVGCDPGDTRPGSVQAIPLTGGAPVAVSANEPCPSSLTTDGDYVYWSRNGDYDAIGDDSIVRAKKLH